MQNTVASILQPELIELASKVLKNIVVRTPLILNAGLSEKYDCNVYLKREDLQVVRSYKIRGAYFKMQGLDAKDLQNGVICASAGNHAQGVALASKLLEIPSKIYMPTTTPKQKVEKVKLFGKNFVELVITGDNFDQCYKHAIDYSNKHQIQFVHPFNDIEVITGQGTVGLEIFDDADFPINYLFLGIGGGGLASGVGSYFNHKSPNTKVIGVEPAGAPAMKYSIQKNELISIDKIDSFVDGAAVKQVGSNCLRICSEVLEEVTTVPEGKICSQILALYNEEGIVVEPAGALTIAALDNYKSVIKGKNVVCLVSGGNNDITRTEEIMERSLLYEGLKHYFLIRFPQRAGALKEFLVNVLGPDDDITQFRYTKKTSRESGPALVGIQLKNKEKYEELIERMNALSIDYTTLNDKEKLFQMIV